MHKLDSVQSLNLTGTDSILGYDCAGTWKALDAELEVPDNLPHDYLRAGSNQDSGRLTILLKGSLVQLR